MRLYSLAIIFTYFIGLPSAIAQQGINYQAYLYEKVEVIQPGSNLNISHVPVRNQAVCIQFSIGAFLETHELTTDEQGMFSAIIGSREVTTFGMLNWQALYNDRNSILVRWSKGSGCISGSFDTLETISLNSVPFSFFAPVSDSSNKALRLFKPIVIVLNFASIPEGFGR
jgi:hypothetical protein